jgi:hypothetical protein
MEMEDLQPFLEKPDNPDIVLLIENADFSWDKVMIEDFYDL